LRGLYDAELKK